MSPNISVAQSGRSKWELVPSPASFNTFNPIRRILDNLFVEPNPNKPVIALSIGDPTISGDLRPASETIDAIKESLDSFKYNGYAPSIGYKQSREAVAEYSTYSDEDGNECKVTSDDVILCSGCSHALDLCISTLASHGDNILVPRPGFTLYKTLGAAFGIEIKFYRLLEDQQWKIDLEDLESKIDNRTAAILLINPSNPCGSVYSADHLKELLAVASRNYLPIIADEIYEHLVFPGRKFVPIGSLKSNVPILSCSGITKRFLVPGWRTGWIVIHDKNGLISAGVKASMINMSQRIIGSNTLVQGALPEILKKTPQSFFDGVSQMIYKQAKLVYDALKRVNGLYPVMPEGAMYMMVGIKVDMFPRIKDDMEFVEKLMAEQSVFCLPGRCFNYPNFMRIVLTSSECMLIEACERIKEFCDNHTLLNNQVIDYDFNPKICEDVIS